MYMFELILLINVDTLKIINIIGAIFFYFNIPILLNINNKLILNIKTMIRA